MILHGMIGFQNLRNLIASKINVSYILNNVLKLIFYMYRCMLEANDDLLKKLTFFALYSYAQR